MMAGKFLSSMGHGWTFFAPEVCAVRFSALLALLSVAAMLSGCAGGGDAVPAPSAREPAGPKRVPARFVITIPAKVTTNAKLRPPSVASATLAGRAGSPAAQVRPKYVSPSTQSMNIDVTQGATQVLNETANLTPSSTGCTSTLASTQCTLTLSLAPGTFTATVTTYDQVNAGGNLLSAGQNVDFTIVEGAANTITLTLSGIPTSYLIASDSSVTTGTVSGGFTISGISTAPQSFFAEAQDADGNFIVGVGAPAFTFLVTNGTGWATGNPSNAQPNRFTVTSPGTGTTATIQATASYSDSTCSQPTAVCTTSFAVANHAQTLFVANCGSGGCGSGGDSVLVFAPPYTGTPTKITSGIDSPNALGIDVAGDLFVVNKRTITVYAPPYTSSPTYTISVPMESEGVLLDAIYDMFVSNYNNDVDEFQPPYTTRLRTITDNGDEESPMPPAAMDESYNLFVATPDGIDELSPPAYTTPIATLYLSSGATPGCVKVSPDDTIYTIDEQIGGAIISSPPYSSPVLTSTNAPYDVTFDQLGDEFAADSNNDISEWNANGIQVGQLIRNGVSYSPNGAFQCQTVTTDAGNDLFSNDNGNGDVTVYEPPYTSAPLVLTNGISQPQAVFLGN
jgi:hypothetical protein